ncbi:divergent polysaccharide deacetylase family protein [Dongia rigui]|uniref:Divergent polysaccharide deacetylase family protein n=1 Tax=Dongia rigui TaxID=940149 RepID=A0ABU5E4D3_9PROT|nr:divergent polysaccharide deacetylase family protein [Dongia rigui]MDY0874039.1 divergent polysaccharide deacetylase family protein [Dongia rigui]
MAKRKQKSRKRTPAGRSRRKGAGAAWRGLIGSLAGAGGALRKGTLLFTAGIVLGLAIGLAITLLAPALLQKPPSPMTVAEAPATLPKSTPAASKAKPAAQTPAVAPDFVEKTPATPVPAPSAPADIPAQAEEGAHQSAPDIVLPAEDDAAALPSRSDKEPAAAQWLENSVAVRDPGNRPMITIVLDDVGVAPQHAEMAVALPAPIVLSIMTYAKNSAALAREARAKGHEIMVHMPMQPVNPAVNPGPNALDVGMDGDELLRRIVWGLGRFKGYVGFNNHMGSRFTQDAAGMRIVLQEAKRRGLLFLDSKTIAGSVGDKLAAEMGVTHIARDIFLDDDMSEAAVARQLAAAEAVAIRQGYAVAIGHPHPGTIAVLKRWLPEAKARGFAIVPLTTIIKKREGVAG